MGRYQPQKVNPELKQYFLINDFSGGINTTDTDERMNDNEFRRLINVDLSEAGVIKRRSGWGASAIFNIDLSFDTNRSYHIFLFELVSDTNNNAAEILLGASPLTETFKFNILIGYYSHNNNKTILNFSILEGDSSAQSKFVKTNFSDYYEKQGTYSLDNLTGVRPVHYSDKLYFSLSEFGMTGMCVYDIVEKQIYFIDGVRDPKPIYDNREASTEFYIPYKPLPIEMSLNYAGYNTIANDPLTYFSGSNIKAIRGYYLTESGSSNKFIKGIPNSGKFRLNVFLTGDWSQSIFETVFTRNDILQETFRFPIVNEADPTDTYNGLNFSYDYVSGFTSGSLSGSGVVSYDIVISDQDTNFGKLETVSLNLETYQSSVAPVKTFNTFNDMTTAFNWFSVRGARGQWFLLTDNGEIYNASTNVNLMLIKKDVSTSPVIDVDFNPTSTSYPTPSVTGDYYYYRPAVYKDAIKYIKNVNGINVYESVIILIQKNDNTTPIYQDYIWDSSNATFISSQNYNYPRCNGASLYKINNPLSFYTTIFNGDLVNYAYQSTDTQIFTFVDDNVPVIKIPGLIPEVTSIWNGDYANKIKMTKIEDRLVMYAGNSILWSDLSNFTYFPNTNYKVFPLDIDDEITAIQFFRGSHLIFTKKTIWKVSGDLGDIGTLSFILINDAIGCIAPNSVRSFENTVVFLSKDGLYRVKQAYYQEGLENVEKIDLQLKGYVNIDSLSESLLYDEQYWLVQKNNSDYEILKYYYDIPSRYGHPYTADKFAIKPDFIYSMYNVIVAIKDNKLYVYNSGYYDFPAYSNGVITNAKAASYRLTLLSGTLSFGYPTHDKKFKALYLNVISENQDAITIINFLNGLVTAVPIDYIITREANGSLNLDENSTYESNITNFPGYTELGKFDLGTDVLGEKIPLLHKIIIAGKAKSISLRIDQNEPNYFSLNSISYLFKLNKVKEFR